MDEIYTNNKIRVNTRPAAVKYNPFLNIVVLGMNIQKEDNTKNNRDNPKKIFKKNNGSPDFAL